MDFKGLQHHFFEISSDFGGFFYRGWADEGPREDQKTRLHEAVGLKSDRLAGELACGGGDSLADRRRPLIDRLLFDLLTALAFDRACDAAP